MKINKNRAVSSLMVIAFLGAASAVSAQTLYEETFNGGPYTVSAPLSDLGWSSSGPGGFYSGYYNGPGYTGFYNSATSAPLDTTNGVYIGAGGTGANQYLAFYTTDTAGSGTYGLVSYSDIAFSGSLTFSIFAQQQPTITGDTITGQFLIQNGGNWYASATGITPPTSANTTGNDFWDPSSLTLSGAAANWLNVSGIGTSSITVGGVAGSNLTGAITGFGFLEGLNAVSGQYGSWNYTDPSISAVPEPSTLAFFCGIGLMLVLMPRRKSSDTSKQINNFR